MTQIEHNLLWYHRICTLQLLLRWEEQLCKHLQELRWRGPEEDRRLPQASRQDHDRGGGQKHDQGVPRGGQLQFHRRTRRQQPRRIRPRPATFHPPPSSSLRLPVCLSNGLGVYLAGTDPHVGAPQPALGEQALVLGQLLEVQGSSSSPIWKRTSPKSRHLTPSWHHLTSFWYPLTLSDTFLIPSDTFLTPPDIFLTLCDTFLTPCDTFLTPSWKHPTNYL